MWRPNGSRPISSCGSSANCRSRGSSSTRRTAFRSGVTISVRITGVWLKPPRNARRAIARGAGHPSPPSPRPRRPKSATTSSRSSSSSSRRCSFAGFDRPNIYLRVERVENEEEKDARLPHLVRGRRALVYAATRKSAEAAASVLNASGVKASAYHAGLKEDVRTRVQDTFARGALPVVCATNAFGMGIDRPDVDAVVHYAIPGSLEAYYQEIGRAGRDGRAANATLLWDPADVATREYLIDSPRRDRRERTGETRDPAEVARRKELEHRKLRRMIEYADSAACLRASILRYFGDAAARERCDACGSCRPGAIDRYERECVQTILGLVAVSTDQYRTLSLTDRGRDAMRGRLPDLGVRRPATGAVRLSRRRERIRDWNDWRTLKKLLRRAWSADPDAPCEFDGDYSRAFDAPDE
jgi:hypothetical protein